MHVHTCGLAEIMRQANGHTRHGSVCVYSYNYKYLNNRDMCNIFPI